MKPTLIFDGAFGTYYQKLTGSMELPELASFVDKNTVLQIHQAYLAAGANALKTNTFGTNPAAFPEGKWKELVKNSYALACEAAEPYGASVFADIGPITVDADTMYLELVEYFLGLGTNHFLFETMPELTPLKPAMALIRKRHPGAVIAVSFAVAQDGYTQSGREYRALFRETAAVGADYVGLNCVCGPAHMLELIQKTDTKRYRVLAMPNAGYPSVVGGRTVYVDNPDYFAEKLEEIVKCGVSAIGGCCGTTPAHIRTMINRVSTAKEAIRLQNIAEPKAFSLKIQKNHRGFDAAGRLPYIAVEVSAPVTPDMKDVIKAARLMKEAGADFVTIPDSPLARTRASSVMTAAMVKRLAGIEAIPHLCCRDRNQIAVKGDLIAGNMEDLHHVLAITGDPIQEIERTKAKNVFGFNSFQLIRFIASLNQEIFTEMPYNICGALNTSAPQFAAELKRAEEKIACGVDCLFTQPLFSKQNIENYKLAKKTLPCRIFAGIMPLAGYKNAIFLQNEVPGIEIPDKLLSKLRAASGDQAASLCLEACKEMVDQLFTDCDGFYIMTPLKKTERSAEIVQYIRQKAADRPL